MAKFFVRVVREWAVTIEAESREEARMLMLNEIAMRHADNERITVQSDAQIRATQTNLYKARKAR